MAASPIAGISGQITIGNHVGRFAEWSLTTIQDVNDCSGFANTSNYRTNLGGMLGYRLSASGYLIDNDSSSDPNAVLLHASDTTGQTWTGTIRTGSTYSGSVILSSFTVGTGINGNATFSLSGVGTGVPTETWDETA